MAKGKLIFKLHGQKLAGLWELVRISKPGEKKQDQWLLLKKRGDAWARPTSEYDVITALPDSVVEKPLGLVEEREPRAAPAQPRSRSQAARPDLSNAVKAPHARQAGAAARHAGLGRRLPAHWIVENKFDGYRHAGAHRRRQGPPAHPQRQRLDRQARGPGRRQVEALGLDSAWLDGEIVVLNDAGVPDFNRLQNAIDNSRSKDIVLFLFDVPFLGGMDLRQVPLVSRRAVLQGAARRARGATSSLQRVVRRAARPAARAPPARWAWKA